MHAIEPAMPGWFDNSSTSEPEVRRDSERADDAGQANLQLVLSLAAIALAAVLSLW
ncbi:MAG: hypothetical protein U0Q11_09750 [Vicinamibacterales bacterium]